MGALTIEDFAGVSAWSSHEPGAGPSSAVAIAAGGSPRLAGLTGPTARLSAEAGAAGHYVERTGTPVDLRPWADLLLWVRSDRRADGSAARPLFLEVRIGSATTPVSAGGNPWRRLVPVEQPGVWQPVPLSLADLPGSVASAATVIRLTCVEASVGWTLDLDAVIAVLPEMTTDVDAALLDRLDSRLALGGKPVPAVVVPRSDPDPGPPVLRLSNYDVRPDRAMSPTERPRTDFTGAGFALRAPATVYQLDYAIEAIAADRATGARMLQFVLDTLTPTALLVGAGRTISAEWIDQPATAAPPVVAPPPDHPVVHVRLRAAQPGTAGPQHAVPPFNDVVVEVDQPG